MSTKTALPAIRFPEFEGTPAWEVKTLDEVCEILNNRRRPITSSERTKGEYPYYGASGMVDYVDDFIFDERLVLIGEDGAKWGAFENTAFIAEGKYWVNNHAHVLKPTTLLDTLLRDYLVKLDLFPFITGAAPPKLTLGKLKLIQIPVPPTPAEQQKIANCLTAMDDLITAESEQLIAYRQHKQGLMQNLFPTEGKTTPAIRFPEFEGTGAWEVKTLGEVCEVVNGGTPQTSNKSFWNGSVQWITPAEMGKDNCRFVEKTRRSITEEGLQSCSSGLLPINSIILSTRAPIGLLSINTVEMAMNQGCKGLIPFDDMITNFFYYTLFNSTQELDNLGAGNTFKELSTSNLKIFPIPIPPTPAEQQKIANTLTALDDLITAQQDKITALQGHKKGLMQQLFPKLTDE